MIQIQARQLRQTVDVELLYELFAELVDDQMHDLEELCSLFPGVDRILVVAGVLMLEMADAQLGMSVEEVGVELDMLAVEVELDMLVVAVEVDMLVVVLIAVVVVLEVPCNLHNQILQNYHSSRLHKLGDKTQHSNESIRSQ